MTDSNPPSGGGGPAETLVCAVVSDRPEPSAGLPGPVQAALDRAGFRVVRTLTSEGIPAGLADLTQSFLLLCLGDEGIGSQLQAIRACRAGLAAPFESIVLAESASAKEIAQAVELGVIEVFIGTPPDAQADHAFAVVRERLSRQLPTPIAEVDLIEPMQSLIAGAKQLSDLLLQAAMRLAPDKIQALPPALREKLPPSNSQPTLAEPPSLRHPPVETAVGDIEGDDAGTGVAAASDTTEALLSTVRLLMLLQRIRYEALPVCTERDVHWQILMFLVEQSLRRKEATVTAVCYATSAPFSTAIRKIDELAAVGWLSRRVDPRDRRRYIVELSQHGRRQLIAYLRRIANDLGRNGRGDPDTWGS